jgi:hypothetical protein
VTLKVLTSRDHIVPGYALIIAAHMCHRCCEQQESLSEGIEARQQTELRYQDQWDENNEAVHQNSDSQNTQSLLLLQSTLPVPVLGPPLRPLIYFRCKSCLERTPSTP